MLEAGPCRQFMLSLWAAELSQGSSFLSTSSEEFQISPALHCLGNLEEDQFQKRG